MKSKEKIKNKQTFDVHFYALIALYFFSLLIFGGFGELTILFTGLLLVVFLFKKKNVSINVSQGLYLIFSVWYFLCSLKNGFFIEPIIKGLVPFVAFLFWVYCSNIQTNKEKIIKSIVNGSFYVALFAILHCIIKCFELRIIYRLTFPFDYSNVCGLYFAVCCFWAKRFVPNKSYFRYVFIIALVLSQSVGAIILFACAFTCELIKEKRFFCVFVEVFVIIVFALFLRHRVYESMGTFLERLLHMYDASLCITKNPISGIGALWWEFAKPYYQTGYYEARVIHSSIFSVGVSSGLFGITLFLMVCFLELKKAITKKQDITIILIVIIHSLVDFSLSFLSVCFVLILSLLSFDDEKKYSVNHIFKKTASSAVALGMMCLISFNMMSSYFQNSLFQRNSSEICKTFNESTILKSSVRSSQCIAARLYQEKNDEEKPIFKKFKYMPTEMILYRSINKEGGEKYLLDCMKEQPYNTALKSFALSESSEEFRQSSDKITENALSELSFFGKKLYGLKGENK